MFKRITLACLGLLALFVGPSVCQATTATLILTTSGNVWTVSVQLSGNSDNLGLSGFDIDIFGTGGVTVSKFTPPTNGSGTSFAPSIPFSSFRTGGSTNGASEIDDISAFQDTPSAVSNESDADLQYNLAQNTPYALAHGFFSGTGILTTTGLINVFPTNFDVIDQEPGGNHIPGKTFATMAATPVIPGVLSVPEPTSMVLLGLAGVAFMAWRRMRHARCAQRPSPG